MADPLIVAARAVAAAVAAAAAQQKHLAWQYAEAFAAPAELHLPPRRPLKQLRTTTAMTMGTTMTKTK